MALSYEAILTTNDSSGTYCNCLTQCIVEVDCTGECGGSTVVDECGFSSSSVVMVEGIEVDALEVVWPPSEVFACFGDNSEIYLQLDGGLPPFTFQWFLDGV